MLFYLFSGSSVPVSTRHRKTVARRGKSTVRLAAAGVLAGLLASLPAPVAAAPAAGRRLALFGTAAERGVPTLFLGQLNNQLLATVGGASGIPCRPYPSLALFRPDAERFALALAAAPGGTRPGRDLLIGQALISGTVLQECGRSLAVLCPTLGTFAQIRHERVLTNREPATTRPGGAGRPETRETTVKAAWWTLRFTLDIHYTIPPSGELVLLGSVIVSLSNTSSFAAQSDAMQEINKAVTRLLDGQSVFRARTEAAGVSGDAVSFLSKDELAPVGGDEFNVYRLRRHDDGYSDERYLGIVKVHARDRHLYLARSIFGNPVAAGDILRPRGRAYLGLAPVGRYFFVDLPAGRFGTAAGVTSDVRTVRELAAGGGRLETELGYGWRLYVEGLAAFAPALTVWQGGLGLAYEFWLTRGLSLAAGCGPVLRLLDERCGTVSDGGALDGNAVRARAFVPGAEAALGLSWLLSGTIALRIEGGYLWAAAAPPSAWTFTVAGQPAGAYRPASVPGYTSGGPWTGFSLNLRL